MKPKESTTKEQKQQNGLHGVLGLALILLSVVLAINSVQSFPGRVTVQTVINILGALLFLGVGLVLLTGALRRTIQMKKQESKQEDADLGSL